MLHPKKAKEFIKPTAEKLQVSEDLVEAVTDFYWKEVRKALGNLEKLKIKVENFGYFRIKVSKLQDFREKYEAYLKKLDPERMTFGQHKAKDEVEKRLEMIKKSIVLTDDEKIRKKQVRERRNAKLNGDLETPKTDS